MVRVLRNFNGFYLPVCCFYAVCRTQVNHWTRFYRTLFFSYRRKGLLALQSVWVVAALVFALNLPFGFWRAGSHRFSRDWFLAVHIPVLVSIGLKFLAGIGSSLLTLPLFVGVFFLGQSVGGVFRKRAT